MGPSQICGCPFHEPRVFPIAQMVSLKNESGELIIKLTQKLVKIIKNK